MAWKLVYHSYEPEDACVGDVWDAPDWAGSNIISERYKHETVHDRPPLMCLLPSKYDPRGDRFLLDRVAGDNGRRKGWDITIVGDLVPGETPDITLHPSVNCEGSWHGYIRNGEITDDCEGRTYPEGVFRKTA